MKKAIFIVGPTSVGKTDLALKISKLLPSILISADSVQVYRGADIISGKDKSVSTYLVDILSPSQSFSVREFIEKVRPLVEKAKKENKIPIIVGGTGFYMDSLFGKIETINIPPNQKLREKLESLSLEKLQENLRNLSPERFNKMNKSDVKNRRRLVRAIEVSISDRMIDHTKNNSTAVLRESEVLIIGLKTSMDDLKERIIARVKKRLKMGAINEAKELFKNYEQLSSQLRKASGYKELFDYLAGKIKLEEAKEKWVISDYQYAKRQMTWFKKNKNIVWFDIGQPGFEERILRLIRHEVLR
ncbi:MAG: tRNA (adenosine(37)-N6)-dimethylallyltransferase MiaA [Candidatus Levybacteria bacterium]|nr:tRNA (adenosine(37)-N6)-dimethylallyltransferase MiaA [Candidatus Levybacteria bacterium]